MRFQKTFGSFHKKVWWNYFICKNDLFTYLILTATSIKQRLRQISHPLFEKYLITFFFIFFHYFSYFSFLFLFLFLILILITFHLILLFTDVQTQSWRKSRRRKWDRRRCSHSWRRLWCQTNSKEDIISFITRYCSFLKYITLFYLNINYCFWKWTFSMWSLNLYLSLVSKGQLSMMQRKMMSGCWVFLWRRSPCRVLEEYSQNSHLKGLSSECVRRWVVRLDFTEAQ